MERRAVKGEGSTVDYTSFSAVPRRASMKRAVHRWVPVLAFSIFVLGCGHGTDVSRESTQTDFGVNMARQNLWRGALFSLPRGGRRDCPKVLGANKPPP